MALPASDAFTGTGGASLGSNWTAISGTFALYSDGACPTAGGTECGSGWNADTPDNDQYAETVLGAGGSGVYAGPAVRVSSSAATYYGFYTRIAGNTYYFKMVAGSYTDLTSLAAISRSAGDTLRIEISGTSITCKANGATEKTLTDNSISSGRVGITGYSSGSTNMLDSWAGGNLTAAAPNTILRVGRRTGIGGRR